MKTTNEMKMKIAAAVAILNRYNWFTVTVEQPGHNTETFKANGIGLDCGEFIRFRRSCATTKYINDSVAEVTATAENRFLIRTDGGTLYTVEGAYNPVMASTDGGNGLEALIDRNHSSVDTAGNMVVVLDVATLTRCKRSREEKIFHWINSKLEGRKAENDKCRTVCFTAPAVGGINVAIFDLEAGKVTGKERLFDIPEMDEVYSPEELDEKRKVRRLVDYMRNTMEREPVAMGA
jgi:hypothetical protein